LAEWVSKYREIGGTWGMGDQLQDIVALQQQAALIIGDAEEATCEGLRRCDSYLNEMPNLGFKSAFIS
jgi:hypothetical protein